MAVLLPDTVDEAVEHLAATPSSTVLAGGTDLMVEVNDGHRRPSGAVVVNGVVIREDGRDRVDSDGALPGRVLRGGPRP